MTQREQALAWADDILTGAVAVGASGPRIAAVLARFAFEDWLDEMSKPWAAPAGPRPTGQTKLVLLRGLHGADLSDEAMKCWHGLSQLCHHHAYELQPRASEVARFRDRVQILTTTRFEGRKPAHG